MPWDFWLVFLFLGVVVPWRGALRMRKLLAKPETTSRERMLLYGSTIAMQWGVTVFTAWRAVARGLSLDELGLGRGKWLEAGVAGLVGGALVAGLHWRNLKRMARAESAGAARMKSIAAHILPHTRVELIPYCGLAVTAGVCEEFLYRGFVFAAIARVGFPTWGVLIASSILFGLAHSYQGRSGVVGTSVLGFVFGLGRIVVGSVVPPMVWHSVVDLVAGIAGRKYLLGTSNSE